MKNYDDMNIFDIASVLHNLCFDENKCFTAMINGEPFNLYDVEVDNGEILINVQSERIKIKELEKNVEFNMQRKVKEKLEPSISDGV